MEGEGWGLDGEVYWCYGWLEEGEEDGVVGVVDYEEVGEDGVLLGEVGDGKLWGEMKEGVEEGEEVGGFYC